MRILIVDDEEVLRDVLDAVLRREGFETVMASTGEHALAILDADDAVDLVILDIMLPGISGIDTLRAMRIAHPYLPGIVITAYSSIAGAVEGVEQRDLDSNPRTFQDGEIVNTL